MANTKPTTKGPLQSTNFWTDIATVLLSGALFFSITPDAAAANEIASGAHTVVDAFQTKNFVLALPGIIKLANILWHLFKK